MKEQEKGTGVNENESDDDMPSTDTFELYKQILTYLMPNETITKALKRLGNYIICTYPLIIKSFFIRVTLALKRISVSNSSYWE